MVVGVCMLVRHAAGASVSASRRRGQGRVRLRGSGVPKKEWTGLACSHPGDLMQDYGALWLEGVEAGKARGDESAGVGSEDWARAVKGVG